jgi:hypothetical protein
MYASPTERPWTPTCFAAIPESQVVHRNGYTLPKLDPMTVLGAFGAKPAIFEAVMAGCITP